MESFLIFLEFIFFSALIVVLIFEVKKLRILSEIFLWKFEEKRGKDKDILSNIVTETS